MASIDRTRWRNIRIPRAESGENLAGLYQNGYLNPISFLGMLEIVLISQSLLEVRKSDAEEFITRTPDTLNTGDYVVHSSTGL